jgi:hypothetical protein
MVRESALPQRQLSTVRYSLSDARGDVPDKLPEKRVWLLEQQIVSGLLELAHHYELDDALK